MKYIIILLSLVITLNFTACSVDEEQIDDESSLTHSSVSVNSTSSVQISSEFSSERSSSSLNDSTHVSSQIHQNSSNHSTSSISSSSIENQASSTVYVSSSSVGSDDINTSSDNNTTASNDVKYLLIEKVSPLHNAINVKPDIYEIEVEFKESIDISTLSNNTFYIDNGLSGTLRYHDKKAYFKPDINLTRGVLYKATLDGIQDRDQHILISNAKDGKYSWSFRVCAESTTSQYEVSWDAVVDSDVNGYRVYYGHISPLSKANALYYDTQNTAITLSFSPNDIGYKPCETLYVSVSALGNSKLESDLSNEVSVVVE